jgi:alpha-tubulin suppressor-like RCC1 family protein
MFGRFNKKNWLSFRSSAPKIVRDVIIEFEVFSDSFLDFYLKKIIRSGSEADSVSNIDLDFSILINSRSNSNSVSDINIESSVLVSSGSNPESVSNIDLDSSVLTKSGFNVSSISNLDLNSSILVNSGSSSDSISNLDLSSSTLVNSGASPGSISNLDLNSSILIKSGSSSDSISNINLDQEYISNLRLEAEFVTSLSLQADFTTEDLPDDEEEFSFVSYLSLGSSHTLAVKSDGSVWAWGANFSDQIGDGTSTQRTSPVQISTTPEFESVSALNNVSVALEKGTGQRWIWGAGFPGGYGIPDVFFGLNTPTNSQDGLHWSRMSSDIDARTIVGLLSDGSLWGWGEDMNGFLGGGYQFLSEPTPAADSGAWKFLECGYYSALTIKEDGTLWTIGSGFTVGLGESTQFAGSPNSASTRTQVNAETDWKFLSASSHVLALKEDGALLVWGDNSSGQLGIGDTTTVFSPTAGPSGQWKVVAAGSQGSWGVKTDGSLWGWGSGTLSPERIGTEEDWVHVVASNSSDFVMAVKTDGTVYAWGSNSSGQLGLGDTNNRTTPTLVPGFNLLAAS